MKRNLLGRPFSEDNALIPKQGVAQDFMLSKLKNKKPQLSQRDAYAKAMKGKVSNGIGVGY